MSIRLKLILSFLLVALVGVAIVALLAGRVTSEQFGQFVYEENADLLAADLAQEYTASGGWQQIRPGQFGNMPGMRGQGHMGGVGMSPAGPWLVVDQAGRVVLPGGGFIVGQIVPAAMVENGVPIEVEGEIVGRLLAGGAASDLISPAGERFLGQVNRALLLGGASAIVVAVLLATLLAGQLTGALRKLTEATRSLAAGGLGHQVKIRSRDEVGQLAQAFNQMSAELAAAESQRRQMSADIAHELRTPLSLILGQSEAMLDEVVPADKENMRVLHQEARRLNRIVEDLRTLSMADAGELSMELRQVAANDLVSRLVKARQAIAKTQKVNLNATLAESEPELVADPDRLEQALGNLLDNALRHTPERGMVRLSVHQAKNRVLFLVEDEGPGIDEADLPHIFERFYRADKARSRQHGGSGLGLAIARSIAQAHGGDLIAANRPEGGARFSLWLPVG